MICIDNLGKKYRLGQGSQSYATLRDVLAQRVRNIFGVAWPFASRPGSVAPNCRRNGAEQTDQEFWALREVSLHVNQGEVIGIIGRNGAGKSTLLKILSRITEPTQGRVRIRGRVASLLEVGTGFHPELTGRENIYLNGAILGMTKAEIRRRFDEIVSFAEVESFLDTPVKRYSSGMYVRLAFAVAAHLEPEILIVDEVLAVGDAQFQRKCLGKMQAVSRGGRTVLFVSHNLAAVQGLCSRAVYLRSGRVETIGAVDAIVRRYLLDGSSVAARALREPIEVAGLRLARFELGPNPVESGASLHFKLEFQATQPARLSDLAILIYTPEGSRVAILDLRACGLPQHLVPGQTWQVQGCIRCLPLVEGDYRIGLYLSATDFTGDVQELVTLRVEPRRSNQPAPRYASAHRGVVELEFEAEVAEVADFPCPDVTSSQ